jgi:hypothetical protein
VKRLFIVLMAMSSFLASRASAVSPADLAGAYAQGKANSLVGRMGMKEELRCLHAHVIWSGLVMSYAQNPAVAAGELGYGYTQFQFHYYGTIALSRHLTTPAYKSPLGEILGEFQQRNLDDDGEVTKLVWELGQCAQPPASIKFGGMLLPRAEHFWDAVTRKAYTPAYPGYAKDSEAWKAHAIAMASVDFVAAANTVFRSRQGGDTQTFDVNELLVAVDAAAALGQADKLDRAVLMEAARADPSRFSRLVGADPATE